MGDRPPETYEMPPGYGQEEVAKHMPGFLKEEVQQKQVAPQEEVVETPAAVAMEEAIQMLSGRLAQARNRGDHELSRNIQAALDELVSTSDLKKVYRAKSDHPVLNKLRRNLGVQKITPAKIEWGGFTWHFAPAPPPVWSWATAVGSATPLAYHDLKVSINVVGIDGVPIYQVLGIEMTHYYNMPGSEDAPPIEVPAFQKYCDACGAEVQLTDEKCKECSSGLDPFDMPLGLRLHCAERFHNYLQKEFGPYEELDQLVKLMNEQMPDRFADREKLYPFLKESSEAKTTTT